MRAPTATTHPASNTKTDRLDPTNKVSPPAAHEADVLFNVTNNPLSQTILLGNNLQSKFSGFFQRKYEIGVVEWKMLVVLAGEPGITMSRATEAIDMDKAAVSRALSKLAAKRLAIANASGTNARSKLWQLTPAGVALHGVILKAAMKKTQEVLKGLPKESIATMFETMEAMEQNIQNTDWE